jgi:hypothetical protein
MDIVEINERNDMRLKGISVDEYPEPIPEKNETEEEEVIVVYQNDIPSNESKIGRAIRERNEYLEKAGRWSPWRRS